MNYEVVFTGGKKSIIVDGNQRLMLVKKLEDEDHGFVDVGSNTFDTKTIKGIFKIKEEKSILSVDKKDTANLKEFEKQLSIIQKLSPEEKARKEMRTRVLPGWSLSGGKREDPEMMRVYELALLFFSEYPQFPRFPIKYWAHVIAFNPLKLKSYWWKIISLNDSAVFYWLKKNGGFKPIYARPKTGIEAAEEVFKVKAT